MENITVSGMAEWLRHLLAKWKVLCSNLTMGKVSEKFWKKFQKKKASYPLLAWWKSGWRECSPTQKKARVCAIMSIWLVHIKEHVWTVGTCPITILLSAVTMCECVCEWQQWRQLYQEDLHAAWGMRPVCSPGSRSGRGWLPLILVWHSQKWLALAANVKRSRKLMAELTGRYIKILQLQLQLQSYVHFLTHQCFCFPNGQWGTITHDSCGHEFLIVKAN